MVDVALPRMEPALPKGRQTNCCGQHASFGSVTQKSVVETRWYFANFLLHYYYYELLLLLLRRLLLQLLPEIQQASKLNVATKASTSSH